MPILLTPDVQESGPGMPARGSMPPADRPPSGGHGGGGDEKFWGPGPRAGIYRVRALLFSVFAVEAALFAALLLLFHARLAGSHLDQRMLRQVGDWPSALVPPVLFLNSAILVTSMLTMARARRHIFAEFDLIEEWLGMGKPALERSLKWLGGTLILGLLFLAGQWVGWNQMIDGGLGIEQQSSPAGHTFYLLAGVHTIHLATGLLALTVCLGVLCTLKRIEHRQIAVDAVAWIWQAMGFGWLLLFAALTGWQ